MINTVLAGKSNQCYMGRFEYGADIITALEDFCEKNNIQHAWINVIGALSKATISYYDQKSHEYVTKVYEGDHEIVSCSGNVSRKDGKAFGHLHIVLSNTKYKTRAGHLMPGTVALFAGEFMLQVVDKVDDNSGDLDRKFDEKTGLHLWQPMMGCPLAD